MKRRDFLKAGGVGLVASAGVAAPAIAQSNPEIRWRLTASWPKALDTLYGGCEYFSKRVAEITDNKFQIQSFAAGEIVPGLQVLDAVSNGTVEMGNTALYYYWGKNPAFTFGTSLPFGLNTRAHIAWLHFGGGTGDFSASLSSASASFLSLANIFLSASTVAICALMTASVPTYCLVAGSKPASTMLMLSTTLLYSS